MADVPAVTNNPTAHRFEIRSSAGIALLGYREHNGTLVLEHTEVPSSLEGGGYGSALARTALDYARQNGLVVKPSCRFVSAFMNRHREYDDLRAPS